MTYNVINILADAPIRLDIYCAKNTGFSRSRIEKLIKDGLVKINGYPILKPSFILKISDVVQINIPDIEKSNIIKSENIPIEVVYEDEDIAIINKPYSMVVHPAPGNITGTLANALLHQFDALSIIGGKTRPGIVHRLDKDTSGIMIITKNDLAHKNISEQIQYRTIKKYYIALVLGTMKEHSGKIIKPVGRMPVDRKKMGILKSGKYAETDWFLINNFKNTALVYVRIITGRTHQIRVHLESMGRPIIGDTIYNTQKNTSKTRLMLHAYSLEFKHPRNSENLFFSIEPPNDFLNTLKKQGFVFDSIKESLSNCILDI